MTNLVNALWITAIGMGLVFLAILALWGLMALIVRVTSVSSKGDEAGEPDAASGPVSHAIPNGTLHLATKRKAAAAAVAYALAQAEQKPARKDRASRANEPVSAWQAVNRAGMAGQRAITSRKKVVR